MMSGGCGSWIGFGSGVEVAQPVVLAFERMRSVRPGPEDDLELLFEHVHPRSGVGERKAVRSVLVLVPASAESELNPSAGALVGGRDELGECRGMAECRGRDHRAKPQR